VTCPADSAVPRCQARTRGSGFGAVVFFLVLHEAGHTTWRCAAPNRPSHSSGPLRIRACFISISCLSSPHHRHRQAPAAATCAFFINAGLVALTRACSGLAMTILVLVTGRKNVSRLAPIQMVFPVHVALGVLTGVKMLLAVFIARLSRLPYLCRRLRSCHPCASAPAAAWPMHLSFCTVLALGTSSNNDNN
jgi:hypothetical protein